MVFNISKNLLPKGLVDRVALKTLATQHQLSRSRGLRKLTIPNIPLVTKTALGVSLALYFMGYQPSLAFPPIQKSVVQASFVQEQNISAASLSEPFLLPHPGYLTTKFSAWHPGIDIATGLGMPIHPIAKGTVSAVYYDLFGLGHHVVIEHDQGFQSTYGHMGRVFVKVGDEVTPDSIIGEVGLTGHTTGPHTHLEITHNEKYIDPQTLLPAILPLPYYAVASSSAAVGGK
ncbi:M23 family metallopeptidase [Patescibacteria group bacterium]|nr:M23 family metallopeptidase [Patescibacteria group bacterium]